MLRSYHFLISIDAAGDPDPIDIPATAPFRIRRVILVEESGLLRWSLRAPLITSPAMVIDVGAQKVFTGSGIYRPGDRLGYGSLTSGSSNLVMCCETEE